MAAKRFALPLLSSLKRYSHHQPISRYPCLSSHYLQQRQEPAVRQQTQLRWESSSSGAPSKMYNFQNIQSFTESPSPSRILIDVREPGELASTGRIPGAQNLPINSAPDGLFVPEEDFEDRFGFPKPKQEDEVIFYCKAGVRSRTAAGIAKMAGWDKVGEYAGSWVDWEKNGGASER